MDLEQEAIIVLKTLGLRLNKDLGQHFLIDDEALADIVEAARLTKDDHVVEIGPGIGILTRELLKEAGHVTAIELDARFPAILQHFAKVDGTEKKLTIVHGNALDAPMPSSPYKIVANIPYHITSPLLRHVYLESAVAPLSATLLIQREVAERICDDHDRGILSVIVQLFGVPRIVRHVAPDAFLPPPKVDSSVLMIESHAVLPADKATIERILTLVKVGFSQKRKKLRNTIGNLPDGAALLARASIDEDRRPQTLTVDEWIALAKA